MPSNNPGDRSHLVKTPTTATSVKGNVYDTTRLMDPNKGAQVTDEARERAKEAGDALRAEAAGEANEPTPQTDAQEQWNSASVKERDQVLVDRIVNELEELVEKIQSGEKDLQWKMPWSKSFGLARNASTGNHYSGSNVIRLAVASDRLGEGKGEDAVTPVWATFKQWQEMGYVPMKGETASPAIKAGSFEKSKSKKASDEAAAEKDGKERDSRYFAIRTFGLHNSCQVVNAETGEPYVYEKPPIKNQTEATLQIAEAVGKYPIEVKHSLEGRASYSPSKDHITMPPPEAFDSHEQYLATLCHEIIHSTGHKSRTDRHSDGLLKNGSFSFGDENYAAEELVAEMGSAILMQRLNEEFGGSVLGQDDSYASKHLEDHAAYLGSWAKKIKEDKKYLSDAAKDAQKAVDYALGQMGIGSKREPVAA